MSRAVGKDRGAWSRASIQRDRERFEAKERACMEAAGLIDPVEPDWNARGEGEICNGWDNDYEQEACWEFA